MDVFFYGLFMDITLLRDMGLRPRLIGPAELPDYQIQIGRRATLIPSPGSTSYGMLIELPNEDVDKLSANFDIDDALMEELQAG